MADTARPRLTSLTVKELLDITDTAASWLDSLLTLAESVSAIQGTPLIGVAVTRRSIADLRSVAEMALDRSLAPKKGGSGFAGSGADIGGGLVVNLNFDQPQAGKHSHGPTIDVTPEDASS